MKNIIAIIVIVMMGVVAPITSAQAQSMDHFIVKVDGLGCPYCAFGLDKKMKELKGLKKLGIDMETGVLTFNYPSDKQLTKAAVKQQVRKGGYTPISVEIRRGDGTVENSTSEKEVAVTAIHRAEFVVAGNCDMCKHRIEAAARSVEGVQKVAWDKTTQLLRLIVEEGVSAPTVAAAVSKAGHDTGHVKADDKVYKDLHGCCKYDRLK